MYSPERHRVTAPLPVPPGLRASWGRRLCQRLGRWCSFLVDTHEARVPF